MKNQTKVKIDEIKLNTFSEKIAKQLTAKVLRDNAIKFVRFVKKNKLYLLFQDIKRSRKTDKVIRDIRNARRNCKRFKNVEDLFEDLDK